MTSEQKKELLGLIERCMFALTAYIERKHAPAITGTGLSALSKADARASYLIERNELYSFIDNIPEVEA